MHPPKILVFDSGLGGITVYQKLAIVLPRANYIYVADNAAFPYGAWEEEALVTRILYVAGLLIGQYRPDIVVIACNTASTIALTALRDKFDVPFVGTVPAIKVAAGESASKVFSVLATAGTVRRDYTRELIRQFASDCHVELVGAADLAQLAEQKMRGEAVSVEAIRKIITPCFVSVDGRKTDQVVLACTHFPLLLDELGSAAPWPVNYIDPAPAIARQVLSIVEKKGLLTMQGAGEPVPSRNRMLFTAQCDVEPVLQCFLEGQGLGQMCCPWE